MVALGLFVFLNSSFDSHPLPDLRNPAISFPYCPFNLDKFTQLQRLKHLKLVSSSSSSRSSLPSSSMETPPEGYRRNVGIFLVNSSNKVFAASRLGFPATWQMPQGGVDEGEDPRNAAIRELREETGVTSAEVLAEVPCWLTYDFPLEAREKINRRWGSDWKGQAQKWFLLRFTGKEEEINLLGDGTEKPEFGEWSWMTPQQVLELAVDFKKPVYEEVLKVFTPYLQSDSSGQAL
ncbi:hypothetical protein NE237_009521 [Protea cynaroides]|uniref:Nudix hydrolase domain-containing protein n=1 Tax=Protea cynaroides TaxID=273540 RepID=A0A9Q0KYS6_9MAGN|nr:hypothetical protein NE237_009521 [Protea cynaroides]